MYSMLSSMCSRQLAVCSWSLNPNTPLELVSACQACEIMNIQLALLPLVHDSKWKECGEILQDSGITVLSGMLEASGEDYSTLETIAQTGGLRREEMWASTIDNTKRVADVSAEMGIPLVTFHAGLIPAEHGTERRRMLDKLHVMTEVCVDRGVMLGLETGQECADNVASVLIELRFDELGVNFDPANMILYGKGDPVEALQKLAPWVKQVHIKDAIASQTKGEWGTEVPVGEGQVDWSAFLKFVPEEINLAIEREIGENRVQDVKQAKQFLQGLEIC